MRERGGGKPAGHRDSSAASGRSGGCSGPAGYGGYSGHGEYRKPLQVYKRDFTPTILEELYSNYTRGTLLQLY